MAVFLYGGGIAPGSLLYSTIGPTGAATFLSAQLSDHGAVGNYNFTIGRAANPGDAGRDDHVLAIGYNTATGGGRVNLTEPAFEWRIEDYYHPGSGPFVEAHWQYYDATGATFRPIGIQIDRTNGGYLTNATMILQASALSYVGMNGTQYAKFVAGEIQLYGSTILSNYVNNVQWLKQENAAVSGLVTLVYLDSSDIVQVGPASAVKIGSASAGVTIPSFAIIGNVPTSGETHILQVGGPNTSAMLAATLATFNVDAGQNVDNSGGILQVGVKDRAWGGRMYGGRFSSTDFGMRMAGRNSTGVEKAYIHLNSEASTILLSVTGVANTVFVNAAGNVGFQQGTPTAALHLPTSTTARASLCIPHGAAPTSPVDGDMWTTTAGLFVRINGVTKTVTLT